MRFDGYLLVSDIDGTLIDHNWNVTPENRDAIEAFQRQGGKFTLATGRIPGRVEQFQKQVRVDLPIICYNGACIYDLKTGKAFWQSQLEGDVTSIADDVLANIPGVGIQIYGDNVIYMYRRNPEIEDVVFLDENSVLVEDYKTVPKPWAKLMFITRSDKMAQVRGHVRQNKNKGNYTYVQSSPEYYEVLAPGTSKGNALETLAKMAGAHMDKIIAVGDNENDMDMVRKAKYGFMTDTAEEAFKAVADFITGSSEKDSIAKVIEKMEKIVL